MRNSVIELASDITKAQRSKRGAQACLELLPNSPSAMGHKQTFSSILAQRLLPGAKQPLEATEFGAQFSLASDCALSSKAAVQIILKARK